jgi:hypothetical protein
MASSKFKETPSLKGLDSISETKLRERVLKTTSLVSTA